MPVVRGVEAGGEWREVGELDRLAAGFNHGAAGKRGEAGAWLWGKNMGVDGDSGRPRDLYLPVWFPLPSPLAGLACCSHQTFAVCEDGSVHGHGIYRGGGGAVTEAFVEVRPPSSERVEVFGGHEAHSVVNGTEVRRLELDAGDLLVGEGELEDGEEFVPHVREAEWMEGVELGGREIKAVHSGWEFGMVEMEEVTR